MGNYCSLTEEEIEEMKEKKKNTKSLPPCENTIIYKTSIANTLNDPPKMYLQMLIDTMTFIVVVITLFVFRLRQRQIEVNVDE
jgi:hypothetical protein